MGDGYECDTASRLSSSYRSVFWDPSVSSAPQWDYTRRAEKNLNPSLLTSACQRPVAVGPRPQDMHVGIRVRSCLDHLTDLLTYPPIAFDVQVIIRVPFRYSNRLPEIKGGRWPTLILSYSSSWLRSTWRRRGPNILTNIYHTRYHSRG